MKKKMIILICVALAMITCGFIVLNAMDLDIAQVKSDAGVDKTEMINEPYDYSDIEWIGKGYSADLFSLPEKTLKEMSTSALVDTVLNLPDGYLAIITIAQSTDAAYKSFLNNYNVLSEISSREDKDQYIDKYVDAFNKGDKELKADLYLYINLLEHCR